jgi:integrase/recombinase XerD
MTLLDSQFSRFLQERKWLKNITPKSVVWYETFWKAFKRLLPEVTDTSDLTKQALQAFVLRARDAKLSPVSVNTHLKALNAFCLWLHAEGHLDVKLRQPLLRTEKKLIRVLDEPQLKRLFTFKPRRIREWRIYTLDCLLVDTGLRIEEALQLTPADVDMNNLLLRVKGKGRKERLVPFSLTLRAMLVRWRNRLERKGWDTTQWLFPTSRGTRLTQRNCLRAHYDLLKQSAIPKCGFHRLRHTFATNYLKAGGELVRLSLILGHANITTTMKYLHLAAADLQQSHQALSTLNRFKA